MRISLTKFGLSNRRAVTLLCFAAIWVALQVLIVTLMLDFNAGTGEMADYFFDCLRDIDRIRIASYSILKFICEIGVAICLVFMSVKKFRAGALGKFWICLSLILAIIMGSITTNLVVQARLSKATENAAPLIVAIKNYEKELGKSPENLQSLVPKYIAAIPHTGIGDPADFEYGLNKKHRWYLMLPFVFILPSRINSLVYFADQNYSKESEDLPANDNVKKDKFTKQNPDRFNNWAFMDPTID